MKTVAVTEFLMVCAILALGYLAWTQQAQLVDLEGELDRLHAKVNDLAPKPRASRAPKPKEPPK
jgi:hypothetical protein